MFGFLKGLVGSTGAKRAKGAKGAKSGKRPPASARDEALDRIRENQDKVMTPERAELIRNAMQVRRAKQQILADLSDEQRQKMALMAMRAFLNEGREDKK